MSSKQIEVFKQMLNSTITDNTHKIFIENVSNLTQLGDNYLSRVLRLDVSLEPVAKTGEKRKLNLVVKVPGERISKDFVEFILSSFKKEIGFYSDVLPTLQWFQQKDGVVQIQNMFPECISWRKNGNGNQGDVDQSAIIILTNLKCQGEKNLYMLEIKSIYSVCHRNIFLNSILS